jgi:hypothetical protein
VELAAFALVLGGADVPRTRRLARFAFDLRHDGTRIAYRRGNEQAPRLRAERLNRLLWIFPPRCGCVVIVAYPR